MRGASLTIHNQTDFKRRSVSFPEVQENLAFRVQDEAAQSHSTIRLSDGMDV
jgi:hypothetical protein